MKFTFILRNSLYLRNFGESIKALADKGHEVLIGFSREREDTDPETLSRLCSYSERIKQVEPPKPIHPLGEFTGKIRNIRNYTRYLDPKLNSCTALKARAEEQVEESISETVEKVPESMQSFYLKASNKYLGLLENSVPASHKAKDFLKNNPCDLLIVSPLVDFDSDEVEYLKAAHEAGIPTCLSVASWDNLTNKGTIQGDPDFVIVWNDIMKQEAIELHKISADRVFVTGAQLFDWWFDSKPSMSREEFCKELNLDPSKKIITYLCSSTFISKNETNFVHAWASIIRLHKDPLISEANIVIRPHPASGKRYWTSPDIKFKKFKNLAVWPKGGEFISEKESARDKYLTTLYWSDSVFGINTSAFLEAGILGKPCFTVENKLFTESQKETVHFSYLKDGGLVNCSSNFKSYLGEQLKSFKDPNYRMSEAKEFISSFLRPNGISKSGIDCYLETLCEKIPAHTAFKKKEKKTANFLNGIIKSRLNKHQTLDKHGNPIDSGRKHKARHHDRKKNKDLPRKELEGSLEHSISNCLSDTEPTIKELRRICKSNKPIIMGPWQSEIGYELLYWIPFLNWCMKKFKINPSSCFIISRGGCSKWYEEISQEYFEILSEYTPQEFLYHNEHRVAENGGIRRHSIVSEFDEELIKRTAEKYKLDDYEVIHPKILYKLLRSYTLNLLEHRFISAKMRYKQFTWKSESILNDFGLSDKEYAVVKFYASDQYLETESSKQFASDLINQLAKNSKVVILDNNFKLDDHENINAELSPNILTLKDRCTPQNNLEIQTALVAGCRAFYGTYGGFSYLAPLYGINSYNFYNESDNLVSAHVQAAQAIFNGSEPFGNFFMCHTDDWELLRITSSKSEIPA